MPNPVLFFKALPPAQPVILFFKGFIAPYIRNGKLVAGHYRKGGKAVPVALGQITLFDDPEKPSKKVDNEPTSSNLSTIIPDTSNQKGKDMALSEEQRQKIVKGSEAWSAWRNEHGEGASRAKFKELARAGKLDHLYEVQIQADAKHEADQKAEKKAKSDKWKEKNIPKLQAQKVNRIEQEKKQEDQWRKDQQSKWSDPNGDRTYISVPYESKEHAKSHGAHWDNERKQWYHTFIETPEALKKYMPKPEPKSATTSPLTPASQQPPARNETLQRSRKLAGPAFNDMDNKEVQSVLEQIEKKIQRELKSSEAHLLQGALNGRRDYLKRISGAEMPKFVPEMYGNYDKPMNDSNNQGEPDDKE